MGGLTARFVIRGRLPGMNEFIGAMNHNRFAGARMKREWTDTVAWEALAARVPRFTVPVIISIRWHEPDRRRDRDNVRAAAKFVLDGLVKARVLRNDTARWVTLGPDEFPEPDGRGARVEVEIKEASDGRAAL